MLSMLLVFFYTQQISYWQKVFVKDIIGIYASEYVTDRVTKAEFFISECADLSHVAILWSLCIICYLVLLSYAQHKIRN